jgi:hypothetical protein
LTIIPLSIVGAVGTALNRTTAMSDANARLSAVADLKAQAIRDWATERKNDLSSLLSDQATADLVQMTLREPEVATFRQSLGRPEPRNFESARFQRVMPRRTRSGPVSTDPRLLTRIMAIAVRQSSQAESQIVLYYDVIRFYQVAVTRRIFDPRNSVGVLVGLADSIGSHRSHVRATAAN